MCRQWNLFAMCYWVHLFGQLSRSVFLLIHFTKSIVWTTIVYFSSMSNSSSLLGNGSYVHTEASSPATVGHVSKLTSPSFNPDVSGTYCLSFYYHMYGASMGRVKAQVEGDTNVLWMKSGNQGDRWLYDEFEITSSTSFRVTFTAIRGTSYTSDAALDEIKATPGRCTGKRILCIFFSLAFSV